MIYIAFFAKTIAIYIGKKQAIIAKTITKIVNCYFLSWINIIYKIIKKYEFDRLIKFYLLSRSKSKNIYLLDKCYNNIALLFYN